MENIVKNWKELERKIVASEVIGKKYVLNFWERDAIVKPYSMLVLGNTDCDFDINVCGFSIETGGFTNKKINMKTLVYGV